MHAGRLTRAVVVLVQIKAFILNHEIAEDDIVAMNVPKFNETQFNTGIAMIHFKSEESVARALELKGTHIGERCDGPSPKGGDCCHCRCLYCFCRSCGCY